MRVIRHVIESNHNAATIVLEVDRETRNTYLYLSVCTKDNFSRKRGVELALSRDPVLFFKLKALDNFKRRALLAVANEMFLQEKDIEMWGIKNNDAYYSVNLLRAFLKGLNNAPTSF